MELTMEQKELFNNDGEMLKFVKNLKEEGKELEIRSNNDYLLAIAVLARNKETTKFLIEECGCDLLSEPAVYDDENTIHIIKVGICSEYSNTLDFEFLEWLYDSGYVDNRITGDISQLIFNFLVWDNAFEVAEKYATLCDFKNYPYMNCYIEIYDVLEFDSKEDILKKISIFDKYYNFTDKYKRQLRNEAIIEILSNDDNVTIEEFTNIGFPDFTDEECRELTKAALSNGYSGLFRI